jgi:hypothetical protein
MYQPIKHQNTPLGLHKISTKFVLISDPSSGRSTEKPLKLSLTFVIPHNFAAVTKLVTCTLYDFTYECIYLLSYSAYSLVTSILSPKQQTHMPV